MPDEKLLFAQIELDPEPVGIVQPDVFFAAVRVDFDSAVRDVGCI